MKFFSKQDLINKYIYSYFKLTGKWYQYKTPEKQKLFDDFYQLLIDNHFFNGAFDMLDYLKVQDKPLMIQQLNTKFAIKKYEDYLSSVRDNFQVKNLDEIKSLIKNDIRKIKNLLLLYKIDMKDFMSYKDEETDMFPVGLFQVLHGNISPFIFLFDPDLYVEFKSLDDDLQEEYEDIVQEFMEFRLYYHENHFDIKEKLILLNKKIKEKYTYKYCKNKENEKGEENE